MKQPEQNAGWARRTNTLLLVAVALLSLGRVRAEADPTERVFPQSKASVERALQALQGVASGRLPALEGFAVAKDHPLDRYQRAFFQSTVKVTSTDSGGSLVRVTTKVTAWYNDPVAARSGYQLLISNGRLEADLLDQLADTLAKNGPPATINPPSPDTGSPSARPLPAQSTIDAPMPRIPDARSWPPPAAGVTERSQERASTTKTRTSDDLSSPDLQTEAQNLEEILKNQAHPTNLVAVKKSGTPVVATPSLTAKALFLASAHDEFEMLDFNSDWVHVRISGISRGWIWRSSLEMPGSVPEADMKAPPPPTAADRFHVTREETAPFPGDWAPLRGKNVKIISVQKINEAAKDEGAEVRLEFAKSLFGKSSSALSKPATAGTQAPAGIVLIFDSVDGGMIAATLDSLLQWKAGKLSDAALWHQCFFDPPETFDSSSSSSSSASQ